MIIFRDFLQRYVDGEIVKNKGSNSKENLGNTWHSINSQVSNQWSKRNPHHLH